ncbi:putative NPH3 domain-containing protein [Helianthus annuus]|uniref:NPH3 domain-containing protein n=1 Tax=Helianthus annuus TaxID=4232 RepID=A0A251RVM8_HELAN|nr:root phototropism protein 3 [Helianthus annuus]KAF5758171.1 putative NPH3 domain-containing protein [Helianthus annuus]KAJ0436552.1 putative NPH3 domain-containing protein [Helianthus annuus]KAJ0440742.1 putative NPH3 domain-containing protein [Helianthus annuus]
MNHHPPSPTSTTTPPDHPPPVTAKSWLDDACIAEIDHFVKTLSGIQTKGVRPDLIGSIITHYACKWIPELSGEPDHHPPPQSATVSYLKKRFFIETIISVLPPEKESIPCSFLLRLLKTGNMVNTDRNYLQEVEKRVAWRLDQATMKEIMIPCFSHVTGTLLDVELMVRLVKRFVDNINVEGLRSGVGLFKVAKLVDAYLAEAAVDSELKLPEFMELAGAVPAQARATDDGLYRAIDTYLKTHVNLTKEERKSLCKLIDSQKLSIEASLHAAQNERLPVRSVIQVLFSEQAKLHSHINPSRTFTDTKSPNRLGLDPPDRYHSSRDMMTLQQMEIKRLKEHVNKLERQCQLMQSQIDKLLEKKKGFFSWRKLATSTTLGAMSVEVVDDKVEGKGYDSGSIGKQTPVKGKHGRSKTPKPWRQSTS